MKSYPSLFRNLTLIFLILLSNNFCVAQLSGSYTLGEIDCDYQSFEQIVGDINNIGLVSDIEFITEPGIYNNVIINNVLNPDGYNIVFRYNNNENDSVCIIGQLKVVASPNIIFRRFSIIPVEDQEISVLKVTNSNNFTLDSCNIINIYNNDFDYDDGLILLEVPWDGPYYAVNINNCNIYSLEDTFLIKGKKGSIWIRNNTITGHVSNTYDGGSLHWLNNIIYCTLDNYDKTNQEFIGNTFYFNSIFDLNIKGNFYNNEFFTNINITASDLVENTFHKNVLINWCDNIFVAENIFNDTIKMKWCDHSLVLNNTFNENVGTTWCSNSLLIGNIFNGSYTGTFDDAIRIVSNVFYDYSSLNNYHTYYGNNIIMDTVVVLNGTEHIISNNNFHRESLLEIWYSTGSLVNNNLGALWILPENITAWEIENNNFIAPDNNVCSFGLNPHFYDPMYSTIPVLHAQNILLTGKGGEFNKKFKYDIDSTLRKEPCTIGANEICNTWLYDNYSISCYDSVIIDMCIDTMNGMFWYPSYLFSDSSSTHPVIYPNETVEISLRHFNGEIIDSFIINTSTSIPEAKASFITEGLKTNFNNESKCATEYHWDFGDGSLSTEENPSHEYAFDGIYNCKMIAISDAGKDSCYLNIQVVGIEDYEKTLFIILPNPARDYLHIVSKIKLDAALIYSQDGQLVMEKRFNNKEEHYLDISILQPGVYCIILQVDDNLIRRKFIKIH